MSDLPAIPSKLDLLDQGLRSGGVGAELLSVLRSLQAQGLDRQELMVHVERVRAVNEAGEDSAAIEDACQRALDLIVSDVPEGLVWDAARRAAALIPQAVSAQELVEALPFAIEPSDLLPPRPEVNIVKGAMKPAMCLLLEEFSQQVRVPARADEYRAAKSAFTTRPASLLALTDRVVLEALVLPVTNALDSELPPQVLWPRGRNRRPDDSPSTHVLGWGSTYVVKADVSHFYEAVEHSTLSSCLTQRLGMPVMRGRALEALLDATMGSARGLPQGPAVSDVLASAYLLPVDHALTSETYVRFADDLFLPAATLRDGRRLLQQIERAVADVGLVLNSAKTRVMGTQTFVDALRTPQDELAELQSALTAELSVTRALGDPGDIGEVLREAGASDERLWDLLYHHNITLAELMNELVEDRRDKLLDEYAGYVRAAAQLLEADKAHPHFDLIEKVSRDGLAFLASSETDRVDATQLRTLKQWFPTLTPRIVEYLRSRGAESAEWVAGFVATELRAADPTEEWDTAWMAYAAEGLPESQTLASALTVVASDDRMGGLARSEALRALDVLGATTSALRQEIAMSLSEPLRVEYELSSAGFAPYRAVLPPPDEG
jgi:hypothetical protein